MKWSAWPLGAVIMTCAWTWPSVSEELSTTKPTQDAEEAPEKGALAKGLVQRVVLFNVEKGSLAAQGGLLEGDLLVSIDGKDLGYPFGTKGKFVSQAMDAAKESGQPVVFVVRRGGVLETSVTVAAPGPKGRFGIWHRGEEDLWSNYLSRPNRVEKFDPVVKEGIQNLFLDKPQEAYRVLQQALTDGLTDRYIQLSLGEACRRALEIEAAYRCYSMAAEGPALAFDMDLMPIARWRKTQILRLLGRFTEVVPNMPISGNRFHETERFQVSHLEELIKRGEKARKLDAKRREQGLLPDLKAAGVRLVSHPEPPAEADTNFTIAAKHSTGDSVLTCELTFASLNHQIRDLAIAMEVGFADEQMLILNGHPWNGQDQWGLRFGMPEALSTSRYLSLQYPILAYGAKELAALKALTCKDCGKTLNADLHPFEIFIATPYPSIKDGSTHRVKIIRQGRCMEFFLEEKLIAVAYCIDTPLRPVIHTAGVKLKVANMDIQTLEPDSGPKFPAPTAGGVQAPAGALKITGLTLGGYAEWLGLKPGDVIASYAGKTPKSQKELREGFESQEDELKVKLALIRDEKQYELEIAPRDLGVTFGDASIPASKPPTVSNDEF